MDRTFGLKIVLFRGRYFVYYRTCHDSKNGLCKQIVDEIPIDEEQYEEWLENQHAIYSKLTAGLETRVTTVSENTMDELLESDVYRPFWYELDEDLVQFPTYLCNVKRYKYREECDWVYLIDLDNERFSVDNNIFFDLGNIPRDRWIEGFYLEQGKGIHGRKFSFDNCAEAFEAKAIRSPEWDPDDIRFARRDLYQLFSCSNVEALGYDMASPKPSPLQIMALLVFERLTDPSASCIWEYRATWNNESFAFRELAFAVLSFAAGEFAFDVHDRFYGHSSESISNGYHIEEYSDDRPSLLPWFGSGCHEPGEEPGSAPSSRLYWFENVLISLVSDRDLEKETDAAIAEAFIIGNRAHKTGFQVIIFSLFRAVMLEVHISDCDWLIRRTGIVAICLPSRREYPSKGLRSCIDYERFNPVDLMCQDHPGFVSLQNFFRVASDRYLNSASNNGRLPVELYSQIIASADRWTQIECSKVSPTFRALCPKSSIFGHIWEIIDFEASDSKNFLSLLDSLRLPNCGTFTFKNRETGALTRSQFDYFGYFIEESINGIEIMNWCPIIAPTGARSIMTQFKFPIAMRPYDANEKKQNNV